VTTDDARDRMGQLVPYAGVATAAAAVVIVLVVEEFRAALWLDRFHDHAALVYALLFAVLVLAAALVAGGGLGATARASLRGALAWAGLATLYTLLASALDLPSGDGSVATLAGVSAYVGTALVLAVAVLVRDLRALLAA
jgi:hypothetical protein